MTFKVQIDWARDGFGATGVDDVTALVRPKLGAVTAEYGRDQSTALAPTVAGRGSITLTNRDKRFSPRNTSSPLYGSLKPARPVRITRTVSGVDYILGQFHTDDSPINPDLDSKTVSFSLVDSLADFRGQNISTDVYSGVRTGTAIGYILDACGWPAGLRDLDAGATVIPWWWVDNADALDELEKLIRSEGPPALLTIGPSGEIVFKDRHHRLFDSASLTSQQTWRGSGVEPIMQGFTYDDAWRNIINTGTVDVEVRQPAALEVVWQSDATITLLNGEQRIITASTSDPFYGAIHPVLGIDYTVLSGTVTVTLMKTSGTSTGIIITAASGAAVITNLQVRAYAVPVSHNVQVSASDVQSIDDYGARSFPGDLPWCNQYDAKAVLSMAVALRADPLPIIQAQFQANPAAKATQLLARDLSDRITIYEDETELDGVDFYIESISHELVSDYDHVVTFGLEAVPATITPEFRFGTVGANGFGNGKFGSGIVTADRMFVFNDASRSFGTGVFAN